MAYALVAARGEMEARGLGTTFVELSATSLGQIPMPIVPEGAQRAIADYLDRETAQIDAFIAKNEELIALTPLEFELLAALAAKPQHVFSREALLEQVWGYHYKADTRLVNVHVQRLRAKIERDPDNPQIVMTVRGVGYRAATAS